MAAQMDLHIKSVTRVERNLAPSTEMGITFSAPFSFMKHWGVILHIYEGDLKERPMLIQALRNDDGKLYCEMETYYSKIEVKWRNTPGYNEEVLPLDRTVSFDERQLRNFIEGYNALKKDYNVIFSNCQEFIRDLLAHLDLEEIFHKILAYPFKKSLTEAFSWSSESLVRGSTLVAIGQKLEIIGVEALKKELGSNIGLFGKESVTMLKDAAGSEFGSTLIEEALKESINLLRNAGGELVDRLLYEMSKGALTWWQLLQIPVELITRKLLETEWAKENINMDLDRAYVLSKQASLGTAVATGGVVGGGAPGMGGAVIMWIGAEVVSFTLRILCGWISTFVTEDKTDFFVKYIGKSRTLGVIKNSWKLNLPSSVVGLVVQSQHISN